MTMGSNSRRLGAALIVFSFFLAAISSYAADSSTGTRAPWKTSRIQGAPEPPEPYRIVPAFPKLRFERPTCIEEVPGANRLLITEMAGKIFSFPKDAGVETPDLVGNLRELLTGDAAKKSVSLFDAEFHPKYRDNHFLFVCYVHPGGGNHTRVSRFTLTGDAAPRVVPDSELVLITWPSGGHNAGCLEFGKDGYLYIATGDGSGPNPPDGLTTGQDVSDLLGAILRIDVDRPSGELAYTIPADNPFISMKGLRPEIWSYGLRNPWKFGVDLESGNIFAADNGWETWEMVHRIVRGGNSGWPIMEGRVALRTEVKPGPTPILPPVKDHPHTEANSVIGGPVYRGAKHLDLVGSFVYGDYITGTVWAVRLEPDGAYSSRTLVDTDQRIVSFTEGSKGEVFLLDYDFTGQIYELVPSGLKDNSADFPRRLSETGLFTSLKTMTPAPGVVPYSVRVNRWMDGAAAERWIAIPADGRVQLSTDKEEPADFPEGTVLVKHLTLPQTAGRDPIRLETQLLHFESGKWRPYSYLWDDAGLDAELVSSIGANRPLRVPNPLVKDSFTERTWHVNATNECKLCHNAGPRFVLGFVPNQLNRPAANGSASANQLTTLANQGVLAKKLVVADDDPLRLVDPHDSALKLDDRARSYLHANCAMCHHPGGNAIVSFFLRRDLPFDKLNTNKGTGIGTFGMRNAKIIVPGDPYRSVLMYRMSKLGYARMPYIGSQMVDSFGVALMEEWIRSLSSEVTDETSALARKESVETKALQSLAKDSGASPDSRAAAVRELVKTTEGTLALTLKMHRGPMSSDDFAAAVALGAAATSSDVRGVFENFVPESKRRATLGANIDPQVVLSRQGDIERGKLIFYSDGARCKACHDIDDRAKSLGPTLLEINKKYPRPGEMLQHVLQPSLKIEEPFALYTVVTDDGRVIAGMITERSKKEVVVKTAEKLIVRIPRDKIEEMKKSDKSLMPDRILSDLTAQEAADLLEYFRSLGAAK